MSRTLRQRLEALEAGGSDQAERYAVIERMTLKWCEEHGIPEPTEAERAEADAAWNAAKPANWNSLSANEQAEHFLRHIFGPAEGAE